MKKKLMIFASSLLIGLTGCNLDVNTDPDAPSDVTPDMILPAAENVIAWTVGNAMYNYAGFFAQYYEQMPEAQQYDALIEYDINPSSQIIDRAYTQLYAGALEDLKTVSESESVTPADRMAVAVLRAFSFQLLVDNMDQAPYSEALLGDKKPMPKWDSGQSIYEGVLAEMEEAENELGESSMTCTDLLLNKNVSQWVGFANALRLRMYFRFIDAGVDVAGYTEKVKALVAANNFFTGDVKFDVYLDETSKYNPWYGQNNVSLANNHCASYPIISYMNQTNDAKRLAYNFKPSKANKKYEGEIPGAKNNLKGSKFNKDYSGMQYYATKPVYFFTQSQLQFLIAEAYVRFMNNDAKAKAAYEAGITADFSARGLSKDDATAFYTANVNWASATSDDAKLKLIYMQKWVALCYMDHMEAWSEIRRTDCPKLSSKSAEDMVKGDISGYDAGDLIAPWTNALGGQNMIKRLYPSYSASQLNTNAPSGMKLTDPVWWDKK